MKVKSEEKWVYLGLGTNLGNRELALVNAVNSLKKAGFFISKWASIYETPPWGVEEQPAFLNTVIGGFWEKSPMELLICLLEIEKFLGRKRLEKWGPRAIDIDILSFGKVIMDRQRLTLPHPYAHQRAFVLVPWAEIAPAFILPGQHLSIAELLAQLPLQARESVVKIDFEWPEISQ